MNQSSPQSSAAAGDAHERLVDLFTRGRERVYALCDAVRDVHDRPALPRRQSLRQEADAWTRHMDTMMWTVARAPCSDLRDTGRAMLRQLAEPCQKIALRHLGATLRRVDLVAADPHGGRGVLRASTPTCPPAPRPHRQALSSAPARLHATPTQGPRTGESTASYASSASHTSDIPDDVIQVLRDALSLGGEKHPVDVSARLIALLRAPAGTRVRLLISREQSRYRCTHSVLRSGYGKLRYVLREADGAHLAAKVVRTEEAAARDLLRGRQAPTRLTHLDALGRELALAHIVEPEVVVHDSINIEGKIYVVTDLLAGDLELLADHLDPVSKWVHGRRIAASLLSSLTRCHAAGFAHGDVKLGNALFRADGRVFLWDFGLAKHIDDDGLCYDNAGTYRAPEQYLQMPDRTDHAFDARVDTWALAVALASFYADWSECPLEDMRRLARAGNWNALRALVDDFEVWRRDLLDDDGDVRLGRIQMDRPEGDPKKRWDDYFGRVAAADPDLCALLLPRMLTVSLDDRAFAHELRADADALLPSPTCEAARDADADLRRLARRIDKHRAPLFDVLSRVHPTP
jgi:serine/threonine protein kinase